MQLRSWTLVQNASFLNVKTASCPFSLEHVEMKAEWSDPLVAYKMLMICVELSWLRVNMTNFSSGVNCT